MRYLYQDKLSINLIVVFFFFIFNPFKFCLDIYINLFLTCLLLSPAKGEMSHAHSTLSVSAPHLYYTCPEGATVKLLCNQRGTALHTSDKLRGTWLFTPHSDQHCTGRMGPRHTVIGRLHGNHSLPPGLHFGSSEQNLWVLLQNVTHADQGRYCCMVLDIQVEHNHGSVVQKPHSHVVLQVTPRKDIICLAVNVQEMITQ